MQAILSTQNANPILASSGAPKIQTQSARQTRQSEELGQGPDSNSTFRVQHCFCCSIHPTPHLFPNTFTESCILPQENTYFCALASFLLPSTPHLLRKHLHENVHRAVAKCDFFYRSRSRCMQKTRISARNLHRETKTSVLNMTYSIVV